MLRVPLDLNLLKALVAKEGNEINVNGKDYFGLNILHKLAAWNASADAIHHIAIFGRKHCVPLI